MKHLVAVTACAVAVIGGAAPAAAAPQTAPARWTTPRAAAQRVAVPAAAASVATRVAPTPVPTPSIDPNTRDICTKSANSVTQGMSDFTTELDKVSASAHNNDLAGAEKSVKNAGAILVTLSGVLRTQAKEAKNPQLRTTLGEVADEFQSLGVSLVSLTALQNFNTTRLEKLAARMSVICGG